MSDWPQVKVTKLGAGYAFVPNTDYRCADCWKFAPEQERCREMRSWDVIKEFGYCIYWSYGEPVSNWWESDEEICTGAFTPEELGYGEDPNGTKCHRCVYFNQEEARYCWRVDENSPGDTPGVIHPQACCAHQEPRE